MTWSPPDQDTKSSTVEKNGCEPKLDDFSIFYSGLIKLLGFRYFN
jgi:hypothetical protein